jgi:hypothetical protein
LRDRRATWRSAPGRPAAPGVEPLITPDPRAGVSGPGGRGACYTRGLVAPFGHEHNIDVMEPQPRAQRGVQTRGRGRSYSSGQIWRPPHDPGAHGLGERRRGDEAPGSARGPEGPACPADLGAGRRRRRGSQMRPGQALARGLATARWRRAPGGGRGERGTGVVRLTSWAPRDLVRTAT